MRVIIEKNDEHLGMAPGVYEAQPYQTRRSWNQPLDMSVMVGEKIDDEVKLPTKFTAGGIRIDLDPKTLAQMFCEMGDDAQAEFLNAVSSGMDEWGAAGKSTQLLAIAKLLDPDAQQMLEDVSAFTKPGTEYAAAIKQEVEIYAREAGRVPSVIWVDQRVGPEAMDALARMESSQPVSVVGFTATEAEPLWAVGRCPSCTRLENEHHEDGCRHKPNIWDAKCQLKFTEEPCIPSGKKFQECEDPVVYRSRNGTEFRKSDSPEALRLERQRDEPCGACLTFQSIGIGRPCGKC